MNGVRLMSIHKSKGLEFPIVILADLDHAFSRQDFDTPVLVHPKMGLGPRRVDLKRKIRYPTLARLAVEEKLRRENLAEEQRILYVAMTRPKEKLILVDALYHARTRLQRLAAVAGCPAAPESVAACKTFGEWLLLVLLCRPEAEPLRQMAELEPTAVYQGDTAPWQVYIHDGGEFRSRPGNTDAPERNAPGKEAKFDPELLSFVYPYQLQTRLPAKVTATQLKGRLLDEEIAEHAARTPDLRPLSQPAFRREHRGLTPAEQGTATHLVLQYLDFSGGDVAGQVSAMVQRNLLTPAQAEAVEPAVLERFLESSLAGEIRQAQHVLREYRFTLLVDAGICDAAAAGTDQVLLQGVVDCCFETPEGLTVVDFKTDRVRTEEEARRRAEHYRPQLEAYSLALSQVLERPVTRRILYFLHTGTAADLDDA